MNLSKNFTLKELTLSQEGERKGIDNTPSQDIVKNLTALCANVLQPLRDKVGTITVSSGYRSPTLNSAIGGAKNSDHTKGMAADIEAVSMNNYDLAFFISKHFKYTQLILEFYRAGEPNSGWVHVSYNPDDLKCQNLTAVKQNGKTVYLNGLQK